MKIYNISNNSFKSLRSPVQMSEMATKLGDIIIQEASSKADIKEVAKMIQKNEILTIKLGLHPEISKADYRNVNKNAWLKDIIIYLQNLLKREDKKTTILIAKNKEDNKGVGFAILDSIVMSKGDSGIIENFSIKYPFQEQTNLRTSLLNKLLITAKKDFKEVFVNKRYEYQIMNATYRLFKEAGNFESEVLNQRYTNESLHDNAWLKARF